MPLDDWTIAETDYGTFQPAIHRAGGTPYELPRPVRSVRVRDVGSADPVPLPPLGEVTMPAGLYVIVRGEIPLPEGASEPFAGALLDALEELRDELDVEGGAAFDLYLHHDAAESDYRRVRDCTVSRFDWDLAGYDVVSYTLIAFTTDRAIDDAAP